MPLRTQPRSAPFISSKAPAGSGLATPRRSGCLSNIGLERATTLRGVPPNALVDWVTAYVGRVKVVGADIFGLDRDGNGIGCEWSPAL